MIKLQQAKKLYPGLITTVRRGLFWSDFWEKPMRYNRLIPSESFNADCDEIAKQQVGIYTDTSVTKMMEMLNKVYPSKPIIITVEKQHRLYYQSHGNFYKEKIVCVHEIDLEKLKEYGLMIDNSAGFYGSIKLSKDNDDGVGYFRSGTVGFVKKPKPVEICVGPSCKWNTYGQGHF